MKWEKGSVHRNARGASEYGLIIILVLLFSGEAPAFYCKGEVNIGDGPQEVSAKCGEPSLKEQRTVTVEETGREVTRRSSTALDEWTYDRGPEELVQTIRFENGKVAEIETHGYGTVRDFSIDTCRNGEALSVGDSTVDAYLKCGFPLAREKGERRVEDTENEGIKRRTITPVVEWTYRYGRDLPGYTVTFENGIAAKISTREFGK